MFFTATYCLPCIEGLQALNRFQKDVGVDRFRVLIVFVEILGKPEKTYRRTGDGISFRRAGTMRSIPTGFFNGIMSARLTRNSCSTARESFASPTSTRRGTKPGSKPLRP